MTQSKGRAPGESHRLRRIEREIREAVGVYLMRGFHSELSAFISVSRVIASKDLRHAKILVTGMGDDIDRKALIKELELHRHEVQYAVNDRLRMKYCPRISFFYDSGFEHALKVDNILRNLSNANASSRSSSDSTDEKPE